MTLVSSSALPAPIGHPWIDEREAPLYHLSYPSIVTLESLEEYYDIVGPWLDRLRQPIAWLVDCDRIAHAHAQERKYLANAEARYKGVQREHYVASALCASSAVVRGVITAVFWLSPPPYRYKVVTNAQEARAFVEALWEQRFGPGSVRS